MEEVATSVGTPAGRSGYGPRTESPHRTLKEGKEENGESLDVIIVCLSINRLSWTDSFCAS